MPHREKQRAVPLRQGELEAPGLLVKMQVPNEQIKGAARESAFLTRSQVTWLLPVHRPDARRNSSPGER